LLFRLNRLGGDSPPHYRDLQKPNENDQNEFVIDWLMRKTNNDNDEVRSNTDTNWTVVRYENSNNMEMQRQRPKLQSQPPPPPQPPSPSYNRCFVCNEKLNNTPLNKYGDEGNLEDSMYICDDCYESWYLAPAGSNPNTTLGLQAKNPDYAYYIVRKKKSRNNSDDESNSDDAMDVINLDDQDEAAAPAKRELKKSINEIIDESKNPPTVYSLIKDNKILPTNKMNGKERNLANIIF
jgi:hypothetical protein